MAEPTTDPTENEELDDQIDEEVDDESQDETDNEEVDTSDEDTEETDDEDDESEDDEDDSDEEDEEPFQKRFTQFKGESPTEYLKNLEDGYAESSKEAVRLSRENKQLKETVERVNALIANSPELAQQLQDQGVQPVATPAKDPAISWAESQMREQWQKEYKSFADAHPEIETDPQLADELDEQLAIVRDVIFKKEKRQVGMAEGLEKAWKLLGRDTDDKQEKIRMASKDMASSSKAPSGKKSKAPKPRFTEAQISVHMEMTGVDRNAAIKQLSEHVK